jgi:hypothetical protein
MSQINETAIRTPGVYTTEIPLFPPSIAQVETAVPAFIGYTEKAERKGESLFGKPTKITSLAQFRQLFGGPYIINPGDFEVRVNPATNFTVESVGYNTIFFLFDALRLFFDNGGGKCYIVSVGNYLDPVIAGDESLTFPVGGLRGGVKAIETYDEPTLILFPDAVQLTNSAEFYSLQQMALQQCSSLQDRFCVFDLKENGTGSTPWDTAVDTFKNKIGINDLNYAACYTPWLVTTYPRDIPFSLIDGHVVNGTVPAPFPAINLGTITANTKLNGLVTAYRNAAADQDLVQAQVDTLRTPAFPSIIHRYNDLKNELISANEADTPVRFNDIVFYIEAVLSTLPGIRTAFGNTKLQDAFDDFGKAPGSGLAKYIVDLVGVVRHADILILRPGDTSGGLAGAYDPLLNVAWGLTLPVPPSPPPPAPPIPMTIGAMIGNTANYKPDPGTSIHHQALNAVGDLDAVITGIDSFITKLLNATQAYVKLAQDSLYASHPVINNLVLYMTRDLCRTPPSGAIAGIYSKVDGTRGVWKSPANESLSSVSEPAVVIDDKTQATLNIDDVAGKSINAIRYFTGKGTLVWGARTLDGNSKEWRYISVRRLFIMVEESAKKATFHFVFEPNDANTWVKVRAMLENYLTLLWRDGALAGAKPEHAFFVKCGLGQTMTADDILDGRLIVEIGMAAVRPAEFIILRFMHKLQES